MPIWGPRCRAPRNPLAIVDQSCRPFASGQVVSARINESARLSVVRVNWRPRVFLLATTRTPNLLTWSIKKKKQNLFIFFFRQYTRIDPRPLLIVVVERWSTIAGWLWAWLAQSASLGVTLSVQCPFSWCEWRWWGEIVCFFLYFNLAFNCNLITASRICRLNMINKISFMFNWKMENDI